MEANQEYFVFISYSCLDNDWAIWLRDELECKLPLFKQI